MARTYWLAAIAVALTGLGPGTAVAHAVLLGSTPAPNSSVSGKAADISLHYNSRVDPERSKITLKGPGGTAAQVPVKGGATSADLNARAEGLAPGRYVLRWEVLSVDGHIGRGEFPFTVTE